MGKVFALVALSSAAVVSSTVDAFIVRSQAGSQSLRPSSSALASVGRRESFGGLLGGVLLPQVVPETAHADDDFLYKKTVQKLAEAFPSAVTNAELVKKVYRRLEKHGYGPSSLYATSLCSDEVNRPLEEAFFGWYGEHFNMGGLAGFPFAGVTGFGAMASHIPDGGSCLIVYAPHVGIDSEGKVGAVNRRGKSKSGTCCGSAVAASKYVTAVYKGNAEKVPPPSDAVDAQQAFVSSMLLPYAERIVAASDPMVELPFAIFEPIDQMMERIVTKAASKVGGNGKIAMLGVCAEAVGLMLELFIYGHFPLEERKVLDRQGRVVEDMLWK